MSPISGHTSLEGRRVTVMGLGSFGGGAAVVSFCARRGAHVTVTDLRDETQLAPAIASLAGLPVRWVLGRHELDDFTRTDVVVANPAVPPTSPLLAAARAAGVVVSSETALFLEACPARVIAVTGTQGKSSTCNSLHQLLEASGFTSHLGGNIGRSLLESAEAMSARDIVVLEISSYQLEALPERLELLPSAPGIEAVCVTNVLADHIERHGSLAAYAAAKRRLLDFAVPGRAHAVLSAEDERVKHWSRDGITRIDVYATTLSDRGLNLREGRFRLHREELGRVGDLRLNGTFQRENTLLALGLARCAGADPADLARALPHLHAPPHRLEDLGVRGGHRVFDNGVSTTPDSTLSVFDSLAPGFCLIVGGKAKSLPLEPMIEAARGRVRRVVSFGAAAEWLANAWSAAGFEAQATITVADAVAHAYARMEAGEELLFSPACASFDQYLNFRERALDFRAALPALDLAATPRDA